MILATLKPEQRFVSRNLPHLSGTVVFVGPGGVTVEWDATGGPREFQTVEGRVVTLPARKRREQIAASVEVEVVA